MKELDLLFKTVIDGMRGMAKGIEALAEKLDTISKSRLDEIDKTKPKRKTPAKAAEKKSAKKASVKQVAAKKPATAADTVFEIINKSKEGVNTDTLMEKTGFDRKKISNIIFKLRKQSKIKSAGKGNYVKA
jgi:predicted Rossmann fold nucleotide-binding protein DprA/Smf involved in DNA uptake